jgi:hypothetical protein
VKPVSLLAPVVFLAGALLRCGGSSATPPPPPTPDASTGPQVLPGELCDATNRPPTNITFDPPSLLLAPGQSRPVEVIVDPDFCVPTSGQVAFDMPQVASSAPSALGFDLRHATANVVVTAGGATGTANMTVTIDGGDAGPMSGTLAISVVDGTVATCSPASAPNPTSAFDANDLTVSGTGMLADAAVSAPAAAFSRTDEFALQATKLGVGCGGDLTAGAPGHPTALGPAVTFAPDPAGPYSYARSLRREIDFAIPANPAAMPQDARLRHLQVLFKSPRASAPRAIAVANPHFVQAADGKYTLAFESPWFGTYQAAVAPDAGLHTHARHLTHRAVMGISMGGGAAAAFGMRHHDRFDAIGALGGPSDWTWLGWYIQKFHLGGFCPASNPGCTLPAPNMYPIDGPLVHTQDFNHWYFQSTMGGGGTFDRETYSKLFWDLTTMFGDPLGQNMDPAAAGYEQDMSLFPAGPKATDPWVTGSTAGLNPAQCATEAGKPAPYVVDCRFVVDSKSGDSCPNFESQVQSQCRKTRCDAAHQFAIKSGYYDDEYNPDGTLPVINVCDGSRSGGVAPYENQWAPPTPDSAIPLNAVLAVDLNGNGVRDMNEPIIRDVEEPWSDVGTDGLDDAHEPGFDPVTNPDPSQDDYDYQINPNGTEGDHHFEAGEPFQDVGLDGVANTKQLAQGGYDLGEGDGQFTQTGAAANEKTEDGHSIVHQWVTGVPAGPLTDDELRRLDVIADGGIRDLFNFAVVGNHFMGALAGRGVRPVAYYNNFENLPGEPSAQPQNFAPQSLVWNDIADYPMVRFGYVDATAAQITAGDGEHVGAPLQTLARIETAFYFTARRWTDADRSVTALSATNPEMQTMNSGQGLALGKNQDGSTQTPQEAAMACEVTGHCDPIVAGPKTGRAGPISVVLPPGYALEDNRARNVRYPVLYALHGYGQQPSDLEALAIFTNNFMNDALRSYATRLPKFIVVYVDGRCRLDTSGRPECVRGTFYLDSAREDGAKMDTWFTEVMDYVDQNYRTMAPSDVEVTD